MSLYWVEESWEKTLFKGGKSDLKPNKCCPKIILKTRLDELVRKNIF